MRGLKWNDVPKPNTGLERCFNFADAMCRAAVGGHSSNAAGVSLDNFIRYAQNPVFSKMVSCAGFEVEPLNVLPGSETRGALATQVPRSLRMARAPRISRAQSARPPVPGIRAPGTTGRGVVSAPPRSHRRRAGGDDGAR